MEKYEKLIEKIRERKSIVIAFSGGADSSLVAKASVEAGIKAVAITIISPLISERERKNASKIANEIGIKHVFIEKKLSDNVIKNNIMRCYFCKKEDAVLLKKYAFLNGFKFVADGLNMDDIEYKGKIASDEQGIWHPLIELGIRKKDVHEILKKLKLSNWNKPSESCLATRIANGDKITLKKLKIIEKAEDYLLNFSKIVRLRLHGSIARIEVDEEDIKKLVENRKEIIKKLKKFGFHYITIDLQGYKMGSMDK